MKKSLLLITFCFIVFIGKAQITLAVLGLNETCAGSCNGQTIVIPSGGTPGYTYSWSSGCTSSSCSGLCSGSYTVTVTDGVGATATSVVVVTGPTPVAIAPISSVTICMGQSTTLIANASGGNGSPYLYTWSPAGTGSTSSVTVSPSISTTYTVNASDGAGCAAAPVSVVVNVSPCLGILSLIETNSSIQIYPNPFTSETTIDLNTDYKNATLKIMDVLGKELKSINFSGKQAILEREELKPGMYFIQIISENKIIATNKIIIN